MSEITTGDGGTLVVWKNFLEGGQVREQEVLETMCVRVAEGDSLWKIAKELRFPKVAFYGWVEGDPDRNRLYKMALGIRAEYHADAALNEAEGAHKENFQAAKLRIDVHRWMASKYNRAQYGDDKQGPPVEVNNQITIVHRSE